jgi:hypothetical protein
MAIAPIAFSGPSSSPGHGYNAAPVYHNFDVDNIRAQGDVDKELEGMRQRGRLGEAMQSQMGDNYRTDVGAATTRFGLGLDAETTRRGQDVQFGLGNRGFDVSVANNTRDNDTAREGNRLQADVAREGNQLQFRSNMAPIDWSREKFGQLFPLIQAQMNQGDDRVGGQVGALPAIGRGPVWSGQQVQEQVNAARGGIDQQAASRQRGVGSQLAGRGFGARSPLAMAMQQQIGGQAMAAGADAERNIRFDTAQGNATQQLKSDELAQQQFRDVEDSDIRRRQATTQRQSSLLSALAGLI